MRLIPAPAGNTNSRRIAAPHFCRLIPAPAGNTQEVAASLPTALPAQSHLRSWFLRFLARTACSTSTPSRLAMAIR